MRLGIFAKTFARPDLAAPLDAVVAAGLDCVQFNYSCVGLGRLPERIGPRVASAAAVEIARHGLSLAAISGTFNMVDPNPAKRRQWILCVK